MAILTNVDIFTLAVKQQLIGANLHVKINGIEVPKTVVDFEFSLKTNRIYLKFSDGSNGWFFLDAKFKITSLVADAPIEKEKGSVDKIKTK